MLHDRDTVKAAGELINARSSTSQGSLVSLGNNPTTARSTNGCERPVDRSGATSRPVAAVNQGDTMFGEIGIEKLLLIFGIVLVIFGAKRLPEIGGSLGKGIREFKRATAGTLDAVSPGAEEAEERNAAEPREVLSLGDNNEDGPRRLIL